MEDDKKNAMTEEVVEIVQQEAELPNEKAKTDPPEDSENGIQEQEISDPVNEDQPVEEAQVEEAIHEPPTEVAAEVAAESMDDSPTDQKEIPEVENATPEIVDATSEVEVAETSEEHQVEEGVGVIGEIKVEEEESMADIISKESVEVAALEEKGNLESEEKSTVTEEVARTETSQEVAQAIEEEISEEEIAERKEETAAGGGQTVDMKEEEIVEEDSVVEAEAKSDQSEEVVAEASQEGVVEVQKEGAEEASTESKGETAPEIDFDSIEISGLSKTEQLDLVKKMSEEENIRKIDSLFKKLGAHFDTAFQTDKKTALETFLKAEGADEADFQFKGDDIDQEFHSLYGKLRKKRAQFFQEVGKEKDNNLIKKNEILEILREIIDGEDQESFNKVKKLQEEWKSVGQVPGAQNQTLWASYHALMDRFYDHRSIYFELKELDRKKNLDAKYELCKKAETLDASTNITQAISQLNELHEEFKHIGPVPREDQEALWQRFKAASDLVYEKRNEHNEHQKEEFKANLVQKLAFVEKAKALAEFDSDRIKHWNGKTKELMELQKQWEAVGGMPRQSAKEVNKAFWGSFKKFFANKSQFFKKLDRERVENLAKKKELIAKALEIRESDDWESTANAFKGLQNQWREIGIVPDKYRKSLYEEFKGHCDYFFDKRRGQNAEQNEEFEKNLEKKKEILAQLDALAGDKEISLDRAFDLLDSFSSAGLVPRNAVGKTLEKYDKVCKRLLAVDSLSESDVDELKAHVQVSKLRNSPHGDRKINRKEGMLKRKISGMENDIYNWKRNIDFFGRSKNAEQMKAEFQTRIDDAEKELSSMKKELRLLQQ